MFNSALGCDKQICKDHMHLHSITAVLAGVGLCACIVEVEED